MSYFVCLDLDHVKKDMPTKSGVFFLNGLTFHKHKMKVSEKAAFFFCYAARLLSIFIFKISLVFSIITFREVILQK